MATLGRLRASARTFVVPSRQRRHRNMACEQALGDFTQGAISSPGEDDLCVLLRRASSEFCCVPGELGGLDFYLVAATLEAGERSIEPASAFAATGVGVVDENGAGQAQGSVLEERGFGGCRAFEAEVAVGAFCCHPTLARALQESLLDEVGLVDVLKRAPVLPDCCCDSANARGSTSIVANESLKDPAVDLVEAQLVDLQMVETTSRRRLVDVTVALRPGRNRALDAGVDWRFAVCHDCVSRSPRHPGRRSPLGVDERSVARSQRGVPGSKSQAGARCRSVREAVL